MTLLLLLGWFHPAFSDSPQVDITAVEIWSDTLAVSFRLNPGLSDDDVRLIEGGLPTTIRYRIELWRERRSWFDELVASEIIEARVWYDVWQQCFVVQPGGATEGRAVARELLDNQVSEVNVVPLVSVAGRNPDSRYYTSVRVEIRPVTLSEIREIEGWLLGQGGSGGGGSEGATPDESEPERLGLSQRVFRLVANTLGLGDKTATTRTESFTLASVTRIQ